MRGGRGLRWRTAVLWLMVFTAVSVLGAMLFVASGIYNVAASVPHLRVTDFVIEFALRRSVATHSMGIEAPDLTDDDLIVLGANHFRLGCAPCHGGPSRPHGPIVKEMYPAPPALRHAVASWDVEELFWIVKHGFKFTGMPAWAGEGRNDEVWALVAFLRRLPEMDGDEFQRLTARADEDRALVDFVEQQAPETELCVSCHGDARMPPISDLVPALQGQSADYLRRALDEYRRNIRQSGIMEPIAAALDEDRTEKVVGFYSRNGIPAPAPGKKEDPAAVRRGRVIAENGISEKQLPPCLACHSGRASDRFPALAGLSAEYVRGQLDVFREGLRDQSAYGAIMTTIAQRLNASQIADVAAYFSSLPAGVSASGSEDRETGPR